MMRSESARLELPVEGMTCASCAGRVERSLNELDGVEATVNYATERASVSFDPDVVEPVALVRAVEEIGYGVQLPADEGPADEESADDRELTSLRWRLIASAALSLPILLISMIPALQFDYWQWLLPAAGDPGGALGRRGRFIAPPG